MAINLVARKTVRAQLASLIQTAVTGAGLTATVFDYSPKTLDPAAATISVTSANSDRDLILQGSEDNFYGLDIWLYVPRTGSGHNEEDLLDDLEAVIAGVIGDQAVVENYWTDFKMFDKTQTTYVMVGGVLYRAEVVPVVIEPQVL